MVVRFEWNERIDYIINPKDDYAEFFSGRIDYNQAKKVIHHIPIFKQILLAVNAIFYIAWKKLLNNNSKTEIYDVFRAKEGKG